MATDCYQSAEAPHSVALASNKYSVKAGSDEVIRIEIDITDKNGIPCPYASNELSFHVSGPLRLLGVDNGNPTDMFPYQQPHCRCFRGKCVVLLQSDEEKGKGTLTVQGTKLVEKKINHRSDMKKNSFITLFMLIHRRGCFSRIRQDIPVASTTTIHRTDFWKRNQLLGVILYSVIRHNFHPHIGRYAQQTSPLPTKRETHPAPTHQPACSCFSGRIHDGN